jgi:hypothetical protein
MLFLEVRCGDVELGMKKLNEKWDEEEAMPGGTWTEFLPIGRPSAQPSEKLSSSPNIESRSYPCTDRP